MKLLDWVAIFPIFVQIIQFLWWLFVSKKKEEAGKKWLRILLLVLAAVGAISLLWRHGWLNWLLIQWVLPVWSVILIALSLPILLLVSIVLIDVFSSRALC